MKIQQPTRRKEYDLNNIQTILNYAKKNNWLLLRYNHATDEAFERYYFVTPQGNFASVVIDPTGISVGTEND